MYKTEWHKTKNEKSKVGLRCKAFNLSDEVKPKVNHEKISLEQFLKTIKPA